jgi:nitrogen fixation/metabolism regulation signal transduction histidine kinase
MGFSHFRTGIALRVTSLTATLALLLWLALQTHWYVTIALLTAAALAQLLLLMHFANRPGREIARFMETVALDDGAASFSSFGSDSAFSELGAAMTRVLERLRLVRSERAEQAQYHQALVSHIPVALIALSEDGGVQLLNRAARRLFEGGCTQAAQLPRFGAEFAANLESLQPGEAAILKMERSAGALQLKAAATDLTLGGRARRLVSLQNIESELTAQELAAWQTVIRIMAHEVTNSLTPISSLAVTARELVTGVTHTLPPGDPRHAALADAGEALDTMARRSEGLAQFVQNHRRLTRRMIAQPEMVSVRRCFARISRLLASELALRDIHFTAEVVPENLELSVDPQLLDQALINLIRNALEAIREEETGAIRLHAARDGGRIVISVADNGPGIAAQQAEKVFVPFYTTKRQGSGIGLTLVRQIATLHDATVTIGETPGGGATVSLRF